MLIFLVQSILAFYCTVQNTTVRTVSTTPSLLFSRSTLFADILFDFNAQIFFADLVGFTNWSADRSPEDVFVLLETIYGAFDAIAEQ